MPILKYHLLGLEEHLQMRGMLVDTSGSALVHKMHKLECNRQSSKNIAPSKLAQRYEVHTFTTDPINYKKRIPKMRCRD